MLIRQKKKSYIGPTQLTLKLGPPCTIPLLVTLNTPCHVGPALPPTQGQFLRRPYFLYFLALKQKKKKNETLPSDKNVLVLALPKDIHLCEAKQRAELLQCPDFIFHFQISLFAFFTGLR